MQFLVLAYDGTDEGAPERRLRVRDAHLTAVKRMFADGTLLEAGAILDDAGKMVGSCCIVEMADRAAVDTWLRNDPYTVGDVWRRVEVRPFRRAPR